MLQVPCLYIVATPIGNLGDISARAIETLRQADYIAAEDTRHSRYLLNHLAIRRPLVSLHEHNEAERSAELLLKLKQNKTIALICDAGTPLISDPGYLLVRTVRQNDIPVIPIPGPCALIAALSASGLDSRRFVFEGFLPEKSAARQKKLTTLANETRTLIFYEAPHRIVALLDDLISTVGPSRKLVLARELTKTFETICEGTVAEIQTRLTQDTQQQRGEFVVLLTGCDTITPPTELAKQRTLALLLAELPIRQATRLAAKLTGDNKNRLYQQALLLMGKTT